jgi:hypothetical protein
LEIKRHLQQISAEAVWVLLVPVAAYHSTQAAILAAMTVILSTVAMGDITSIISMADLDSITSTVALDYTISAAFITTNHELIL